MSLWLLASGVVILAEIVFLTRDNRNIARAAPAAAAGSPAPAISANWFLALYRPDRDEPPQVHRFAADPGEVALSGFRPGQDIVEIDLSGVTGDLYFDTLVEPARASLSLTVSDSQVLTLRFAGLSDVPCAEVTLLLRDAVHGTIRLSLAELSPDHGAGTAPDVAVRSDQGVG